MFTIFFFLSIGPARNLPLFPYSALFRSRGRRRAVRRRAAGPASRHRHHVPQGIQRDGGGRRGLLLDRKSTRLNSSHLGISYAVLSLQKKKADCPTKHSKPINST